MENKKNIVLVLLGLIVVIGLTVALLYSKPSDIVPPSPIAENSPTQTIEEQQVPPPEPYVPKDGMIQPVLPLERQADAIIDITINGFSPSELIIKKGESVIWTSRDQYNKHQLMATGPSKYPEKGECGTVLDFCEPLQLGQSYRVTFNDVGTWTYADKLNPKFTGSVTVE